MISACRRGQNATSRIAHVKRWIERAEILGAPVIRIFSGNAAKDTTVKERTGWPWPAIEECCEYAGQHGVYLALENHGGLTATADGILALVRDVQSPWFAVNLDTGNFNTPDPYADLERVAPYAVNVQVKVSMHPAGGDDSRPICDGWHNSYCYRLSRLHRARVRRSGRPAS